MNSAFKLCMKPNERSAAINSFNSMFKNIKAPIGKDKLVIFRNEPVNIKIDVLHDPANYAITSKLDGVRTLLFIDRNTVYFVNSPFEIVKISTKETKRVPQAYKDICRTIIDGELVISPTPPTFYGFDGLYFRNENITSKHLKERLKIVDEVESRRNDMAIDTLFQIKSKTFHTENFYTSVEKALNDNKNYEEGHPPRKTDGLIIQPRNQPYINRSTYKWKPVDQLTIDFKVVQSEKKNEFNLTTFEKTKEKIDLKTFTGTQIYPYNKTIKFKDSKFSNENVADRIIEFKWDYDKKKFKPTRYRDDRPYPNKTSVAKSVWGDINNPIYESTMLGKDLVVMRKYHNKIKQFLLGKFGRRGMKVLDIGSGRGGDLAKWESLDLTVYGVDPNKENVKEFKRRQEVLNVKNVSIIETGAEDTEKIQKVVNKVDMITAFFSLTFFPSSEKMYDGLINTIDQLLDSEGLLIGIVLDGEKVRELMTDDLFFFEHLRSPKKQDYEQYHTKYSTSAFSIKRKNKWSGKQEFGNKLEINIIDESSMVKSQTEYLFYFNEFKDKLASIGIDLFKDPNVIKSPYEDMFIDRNINFLPKDSQEFSKLNRIFAFKRRITKKILPPVGVLPKGKPVFTSIIGENLWRESVISDNSSLIHAIVQSFSKNYLSMRSQQKRKNYIEIVRKKLGYNLTQKSFEQLGTGILNRELTRNYKNIVRDKDEQVASKVAYSKFKLLLDDLNEWLGDNLEIIQYISDILDLNIYLVSNGTRDVYLPKAEGKLSKKQTCDLLYKNRLSIIILNLNDIHFEVIGQGNKTSFDPNDPMIKQIHEKLC